MVKYKLEKNKTASTKRQYPYMIVKYSKDNRVLDKLVVPTKEYGLSWITHQKHIEKYG